MSAPRWLDQEPDGASGVRWFFVGIALMVLFYGIAAFGLYLLATAFMQ